MSACDPCEPIECVLALLLDPPERSATWINRSAISRELSIAPTRCVVDDAVDGGLRFTEDVPMTMTLDVEDLAQAFARYAGETSHDSAVRSAGSFVLSVRAEVECKGQVLVAEFLPFSLNASAPAMFKLPSGRSGPEKARALQQAANDPEGPAGFLGEWKTDLFRSKGESARSCYAVLRAPVGTFDDLFTGHRGHSGNRMLLGLAPPDWKARAADLLESEYFRHLRHLLDEGMLGRAVRSRALDDPDEKADNLVGLAQWAAVRRAIAGPEDFDKGPGPDGTWRNQPVAHLAGRYFVRILREVDRRAKRKTSREQIGLPEGLSVEPESKFEDSDVDLEERVNEGLSRCGMPALGPLIDGLSGEGSELWTCLAVVETCLEASSDSNELRDHLCGLTEALRSLFQSCDDPELQRRVQACVLALESN